MLPALSGVSAVDRPPESGAHVGRGTTGSRALLSVRVSASLLDGVSGGVVMAAVGVFADWAALQVPGFEPSISRELDVVDAGFGSMIGETSRVAFIVLGVALSWKRSIDPGSTRVSTSSSSSAPA